MPLRVQVAVPKQLGGILTSLCRLSASRYRPSTRRHLCLNLTDLRSGSGAHQSHAVCTTSNGESNHRYVCRYVVDVRCWGTIAFVPSILRCDSGTRQLLFTLRSVGIFEFSIRVPYPLMPVTASASAGVLTRLDSSLSPSQIISIVPQSAISLTVYCCLHNPSYAVQTF